MTQHYPEGCWQNSDRQMLELARFDRPNLERDRSPNPLILVQDGKG
ncbi:hypothetical protein H6G20_24010 [Desertifilum sp. FACHB-1129]|uniref:Uncharacterized protein n=1 Tax=Desertifilum tharense IPPAS B-1220 TaxID=1781255 RepID=A0ACD5GV42_9CYAN|nr:MULTISPECIES: hypothetical protein [Desertifilum]MCD8488633.1 hypothetical protein [Desertifilum sp.]MDA0213240.1 hypothetical protein [Cyanobacteria bacterium FC1]MDI9638039.1 hypothetical protein [Geitlerinema splendidum]MBD2314737.1 hypothetical protein [Desertifilum sp. FACHB-1129]MBD2323940.1 hypothetical protein [Desertifilum sp. FACHB-866]